MGTRINPLFPPPCPGNAPDARAAIAKLLLDDEHVVKEFSVSLGSLDPALRCLYDLLLTIVAILTLGIFGRFCRIGMAHEPSSKLFVTTAGRVFVWHYNAVQGCYKAAAAASIRVFDVSDLVHTQVSHSHSPIGCIRSIMGQTCVPVRAPHSSALVLTFKRFPVVASAANDLMGLPCIVRLPHIGGPLNPATMFGLAEPYSGGADVALLGPVYITLRTVLRLVSGFFRAILGACSGLIFGGSLGEAASTGLRSSTKAAKAASGGMPVLSGPVNLAEATLTSDTSSLTIHSVEADADHSDGDHGLGELRDIAHFLMEMRNQGICATMAAIGEPLAGVDEPGQATGPGWRVLQGGAVAPLVSGSTGPDDPAAFVETGELADSAEAVDERAGRSAAGSSAKVLPDGAPPPPPKIGASCGKLVVNIDPARVLPLVRGERVLSALPSKAVVRLADILIIVFLSISIIVSLVVVGTSAADLSAYNQAVEEARAAEAAEEPDPFSRFNRPSSNPRGSSGSGTGTGSGTGNIEFDSLNLNTTLSLTDIFASSGTGLIGGLASTATKLRGTSRGANLLILLCLASAVASTVMVSVADGSTQAPLALISAVISVLSYVLQLVTHVVKLASALNSVGAVVLTSHRVVSIGARSAKYAKTGDLSDKDEFAITVESWWLASAEVHGAWSATWSDEHTAGLVTSLGVLQFEPDLADFWPWEQVFGSGTSSVNRARTMSFFRRVMSIGAPERLLEPDEVPRSPLTDKLTKPGLWDPVFRFGGADGGGVRDLLPLLPGEGVAAYIDSLQRPSDCGFHCARLNSCGTTPNRGYQRIIVTDRRVWAVGLTDNNPFWLNRSPGPLSKDRSLAGLAHRLLGAHDEVVMWGRLDASARRGDDSGFSFGVSSSDNEQNRGDADNLPLSVTLVGIEVMDWQLTLSRTVAKDAQAFSGNLEDPAICHLRRVLASAALKVRRQRLAAGEVPPSSSSMEPVHGWHGGGTPAARPALRPVTQMQLLSFYGSSSQELRAALQGSRTGEPRPTAALMGPRPRDDAIAKGAPLPLVLAGSSANARAWDAIRRRAAAEAVSGAAAAASSVTEGGSAAPAESPSGQLEAHDIV